MALPCFKGVRHAQHSPIFISSGSNRLMQFGHHCLGGSGITVTGSSIGLLAVVKLCRKFFTLDDVLTVAVCIVAVFAVK